MRATGSKNTVRNIRALRSERNIRHLFIANGKMLRVFQFAKYIQSGHFTVENLMEKFDISERTVYRYFNLLETIDFEIDKDFEGKYFVSHVKCPVCGCDKTNERG